ncbi:MAG: NifU family protein [Planctomycetes bacterium]|nr:NifU family protein [Planctomycetota bacterium]
MSCCDSGHGGWNAEPEDQGQSAPIVERDPELYGKVQSLLDEEINPSLAYHGGFVRLLEASKDSKVFIQLGGGCQGCGMVDVTLKYGIETLLKERFPQITEVLDTTDHASGRNPYYTPSRI